MVQSVNHNNMETTFYEEYSPSANIENAKRSNLTLNLNGSLFKKTVFAPVLSTPDVDMLKLPTPDLEKFIGEVQTTPTPGAIIFPTSQPTEEQKSYVLPFERALEELRHNDSNSNGPTYADLDRDRETPFHTIVKDEPQTVPSVTSSPPMSPIDMDTQEKIKLERKRQRNRVAASKCRKRKLERISRLEDKVKLLKSENSDLSSMVFRLKDHVTRLKAQVLEHYNNGCTIENPFP